MPSRYEIYITGETPDGDATFTLLDGKMDLISSVNHMHKSRITTVPVQDGSVLTDNIRNEPVVLNLVAHVSDYYTEGAEDQIAKIQELEDHLNRFWQVSELLNAPQDLLKGTADFIKGIFREEPELGEVQYQKKAMGRPEQALADLLKKKTERTLLSVSTMLTSYDNLLIESLSFSESFETGRSLVVNITLKEVLFASQTESKTLVVKGDLVIVKEESETTTTEKADKSHLPPKSG